MNPLTIDPAKTALVVIDLQNRVLKMDTEPHSSTEVIANASKLVEAFRKKQMLIFLVRVTPSADAKDALKPVSDAQGPAFPKFTGWADLVPEMEPGPNDFVITKRQWSAFYGTELDLQLRRRGIETIVLCGINTNVGVESTARVAYEYGYQQIFVEDASAALSRNEHDHTMKTTFPRIGRVRKTEEVLAALA